ncbi:MAG: KpsF/GutQ family sugar-phosphate isomerase [Candidatus Gastranaerophilales bacterium]|nr:KpsF/GutQ family sugar-phosphate isomerase [Candidatus Gastranaerophilales bacterium]
MQSIEQDIRKKLIESAKEVFKIEADSISQLSERLNDSFVEAIEILYTCKGRVVISGMGKSGLIGKKIAATLSSTGTPSYFLHPAESTHGDSGILTKQDVVIAISNSGNTNELLQLLPIIKRLGIKIIAIVGNVNSVLGEKSDVVLDVSVEREACPLNKAPTASTTATLAMGDALAVCLLKKRGFTAEDFLLFHPSGSLGKGFLYTIEELMHADFDLPVLKSGDSFQKAVNIITEKRLGIGIIVDNEGKTTGVLSDGDIRRAVLKYSDTSNLTVDMVMNNSPKFIRKNDLAAKALQMMETYSITSLLINDDDLRPIGIIHIHDLLKAGVA